MNLRDLQYVVAVAEAGHFGQAAERCNVSQPTLSAQIKKLEEFLGVSLFERNNKQVRLTAAGEQILPVARRVLEGAEHIKEVAQGARDPMAGPFRLGAFPTFAPYFFPMLVPKLVKKLPKLKLMLVEEKTDILLEQLRAGKLDAALLALPIDGNDLEYSLLFEDAFRLAVPKGHALASRKRLAQRELVEHDLLLLEDGHCLREQALEVCRLNGGGETQDFRATSLETLRQMVRAGTGITLMPEIALQKRDADIVTIPFTQPVPRRKIALVWRKSSPRAALMQAMADIAQNTGK